MEDFGVWAFQENVDDLRRKLEYVTYELEITRKVTNEEIMKNNVNIKKLLQLLQITCKERDDAKSNLKKLQQFLALNNNNINKSLNVKQLMVTSPTFSHDSPLLSNKVVVNQNNSFSQQCHESSPIVDALSYNGLTTNSSPESSNICYGGPGSPILMASTTQTTIKPVDRATLMIESLGKGKPRPAQGKLLQTVLEAGPLLETLMIAGPLPQWRNPPGQMTQQLHPLQRKQGDLPVYGQICGGAMGASANSMLEFGCALSGKIMTVSFDCHQTPKRQRIQ